MDRRGWTIFLVILAACGWVWRAGGIDKAWYSVKYTVSPDQVQVATKPKDCDFAHPPVGNKECHYEANVSAYNAAGDQIGGDAAPTWIGMQAAETPNQGIKSVVVTWSKVND